MQLTSLPLTAAHKGQTVSENTSAVSAITIQIPYKDVSTECNIWQPISAILILSQS